MSLSRHNTLLEPVRRYRYELFGLSLQSDLAIPGLVEAEGRMDASPIQIEFDRTPESIVNPDYQDEQFRPVPVTHLLQFGHAEWP